MLDKIKNLWNRIKSTVTIISQNRVASWITHWMIAFIPVLIVYKLTNALVGWIASLVVLLIFAVREGINYENHRIYDPSELRYYTVDGIMDLAGPLLAYAIFSYVVIAA